MNIIDFDSNWGKTQAAFVALFARDGIPWEAYSQDQPDEHSLKIPVCLMINRADGAVGFAGGKVEKNESLEAAAIRETQEEVGYKIDRKLIPVVAHDIGPITTHLFALEMQYNELREIQKNAVTAEHFGSEITGVFLPHLIDYARLTRKDGGVSVLLRSALAKSVREELAHFLLKMKIFDQPQLKITCETAGYPLDKLLA